MCSRRNSDHRLSSSVSEWPRASLWGPSSTPTSRYHHLHLSKTCDLRNCDSGIQKATHTQACHRLLAQMAATAKRSDRARTMALPRRCAGVRARNTHVIYNINNLRSTLVLIVSLTVKLSELSRVCTQMQSKSCITCWLNMWPDRRFFFIISTD